MAKILVAEDDAASRNLMAAFLTGRGHQVAAVEDGLEALRRIREESPDLLITDVSMPNMDGMELIDKLREEPSTAGLPVIMLSALTESEQVLAGLKSGADDYIPKPVNLAVLDARLKAVLARARGSPPWPGG